MAAIRNHNRVRHLALSISLMSFAELALSGCSNKVGFGATSDSASGALSSAGTSSSASGSLTAPGCVVSNITVPTKIMFLVDTSGSNVSSSNGQGAVSCPAGDSNCIPATDPNKAFREGSINSFFSQYSYKTNFFWGFSTFSNDKATSYINNSSGQASFTNVPSAMANAIAEFAAEKDSGDTPYHLAIAMAIQAVQNDADLHASVIPNYFIVLGTDGYPSDYTSGGAFNESLVQADIDKLIAISPGHVSFSTVYYGSKQVPEAVSLLQTMAMQGDGEFANASGANPSFTINDVVTGPACQ